MPQFDYNTIVNRALQSFGSRTTVTAAELAAGSTNEAIQANLILQPYRQKLLRMAPWDCAFNYANLSYITSAPGTPENQSPGLVRWQKGIPAPPWNYEYCYPIDCLRACWIVPQFQTGFAGGVPITSAVTGGAPTFWQGPPIPFKVTIDQFFTNTSVSIRTPGTGYAVGDVITLATLPSTSPPIGAPAKVSVLSVDGSGAILTVELTQELVVSGSGPSGGSYFVGVVPGDQGSAFNIFTKAPSAGIGAAFNSGGFVRSSQRVILTNQEFATLAYVSDVIDLDTMDPLFIEAWVKILGAGLVRALSGDKATANALIALANEDIMEARKADGNEGLTVNDVTPDWIRTRGVNFMGSMQAGPNFGFEWGGLFPVYG
jgi:hypothetical protein